MRVFLFALLIATLLAPQVLAKNGGEPVSSPFFIELWNNLAYYDTSLERPRFASILGRFEGKLGLNFFSFPLQFYGVYYGVSSQDPHYWNNSLFSGAGARITPFRGIASRNILTDIIQSARIYYEELSASYMKEADLAEAAGLAKTDRRVGIEIYREWNLDNPDMGAPFGELWVKYDHRETNFGWEPFNERVLYMQPKMGRHLGDGIGVYLRADVTSSGKDGPSYSFLNIADYGVGIKFEPWRQIGQTDDLLRKFKMFAEVLGVSYLKDKPADPSKIVDSDVRFGIEFSYGR